jgi:Protein of unknown function (DUF2442)
MAATRTKRAFAAPHYGSDFRKYSKYSTKLSTTILRGLVRSAWRAPCAHPSCASTLARPSTRRRNRRREASIIRQVLLATPELDAHLGQNLALSHALPLPDAWNLRSSQSNASFFSVEDFEQGVDVTVTHVECDDERLSLTLNDGRSLVVPLSWFPRLQAATQQQRDAVRMCAEGLHWEEINENLSLAALMEGKDAPEGQFTGAACAGGEGTPTQRQKACHVVRTWHAWLRRTWPLILNSAAVIAFAITTVIQVTSLNRTLAATQMQTRALVTNALLERWDGSVLFRDLEESIADGSFKYNRSEDGFGLGTAPEQIMAYLNFLEDVALFYHQGVIDTEILDALFGAAILEAYFNPEMKAYVEDTRNEQSQKDAFSFLQAAAEEIRERPFRQELVAQLSRSGVVGWPPVEP